MTQKEFQAKHGTEFQKFLLTDMGKDMVNTLEELRIAPNCSQLPHYAHYTLGGVAGYEECIRRILTIGIFVPPMANPDQSYGHKKPIPDKAKDGDF